jgi:RecB family endonuclease NucS
MRLVIAECTVDYAGRLSAHLPLARRLVMVKADGCVAIHADGGAYKPLNWMNAPNTLVENTDPTSGESGLEGSGLEGSGLEGSGLEGSGPHDPHLQWIVTNPKGETLTITFGEVFADIHHELGVDPGLQKDGVEAHLQELLAANPGHLADGLRLVRREYPTDIGPVDLLCRDADGQPVAIEVKRRGDIDGVEQLGRYLERLSLDPTLRGVRGLFVAQVVKPQARVLAEARGIDWCQVDYDELRGLPSDELRLF